MRTAEEEAKAEDKKVTAESDAARDEITKTAGQPEASDAEKPQEDLQVVDRDVSSKICKITLSTDAIEAYATIEVAQGSPYPESVILEELAKEKVTFGIDENLVKQLASSSGERGVPILIAKGYKPSNGEDGSMEYFFDPDPKPQFEEKASGKVNFRETEILQSVKEGDLLAVRKPGTSGESGMTVTGVQISPKPGEETPLKAGRNTKYEDDDKQRIISTLSGYARVSDRGEIEVVDVLRINGHIDMKTGNVRFDGDVVIDGDIRSGFSVIATRDVEVKGIVEDAEIHCGGKLIIRGGFIGTGKGLARVVGETHIKFLENQTIICDSDVYVAEEIIHAKVITSGNVYVKYGKGTIIGGHIRAKKTIEAKNIGNYHYLKTLLEVGYDPKLDEVLDDVVTALNSKKENKEKIQDAVGRLVKQKYNDDVGDGKAQIYLQSLYQALREYDNWMDHLEKFQVELGDERSRIAKGAYIKADEKMHPGVILSIDRRQLKLDQEFDHSTFVKRGDQVQPLQRKSGGLGKSN